MFTRRILIRVSIAVQSMYAYLIDWNSGKATSGSSFVPSLLPMNNSIKQYIIRVGKIHKTYDVGI
jgi:hypothetical protein